MTYQMRISSHLDMAKLTASWKFAPENRPKLIPKGKDRSLSTTMVSGGELLLVLGRLWVFNKLSFGAFFSAGWIFRSLFWQLFVFGV